MSAPNVPFPIEEYRDRARRVLREGDLARVTEPGRVQLWVGGCSDEGRLPGVAAQALVVLQPMLQVAAAAQVLWDLLLPEAVQAVLVVQAQHQVSRAHL